MARPTPRLFTLGLGLTLGLSLALALGLSPQHLCHLLCDALLWVQARGVVGVIAYVVIYNLATVLFVPGALLTLAGGAIYGLGWGSLYALLAATLGATSAFAIGRYLARGPICRRLRQHSQFQALDRAVARSGVKIVLLTRLSPLLPFNLLNYAYGVTSVSFFDYLLGSLGMVPGTVMYVYLGALTGDIATLGSQADLPAPARWLHGGLHGLGLLATVFVTVWVARRARQSLEHMES